MLGMSSMLAILISGFYMMATVWGGVAWISVSLLVIGVAFVLGLASALPVLRRERAQVGSAV